MTVNTILTKFENEYAMPVVTKTNLVWNVRNDHF